MSDQRRRITKLDELNFQQSMERYRSIERVAIHVLPKLIAWSGAVVIAYFLAGAVTVSVRELAGKLTLTDMSVSGMAGIFLPTPTWCYVAISIGIFFSVVGISYGLRQRQLRRTKTAQLTERIAILEKKIDPQRTSSGLEQTGETREEDR